jgi:hypothetical protein
MHATTISGPNSVRARRFISSFSNRCLMGVPRAARVRSA